MRLKTGSKIRIKESVAVMTNGRSEGGLWFNEDMMRYFAGETVTIEGSEECSDTGEIRYYAKDWWWSEDWIDPVPEEVGIVW